MCPPVRWTTSEEQKNPFPAIGPRSGSSLSTLPSDLKGGRGYRTLQLRTGLLQLAVGHRVFERIVLRAQALIVVAVVTGLHQSKRPGTRGAERVPGGFPEHPLTMSRLCNHTQRAALKIPCFIACTATKNLAEN
jgi:hypothetical protein